MTKQLHKVHKNTVKASLRRGNPWTGYLCASNVASYHVVGGWHVGCEITVESIEELDKRIANYAYYNCNSELGQSVRLWEVT